MIAPQEPEPTAAWRRRPSALGASKVPAGMDFNVHEDSGRLVYEDGDGLLDLPLPRLAGRHQHTNAGTAIAAPRAPPAMAACRRLPSSAGSDRGRMAYPACKGWLAASSPNSRRPAPSSGSTAATTLMAGACSPVPWPISRRRTRRRW